MNSRIRIFSSTKCQWHSRRATSCPEDGKLSLKADAKKTKILTHYYFPWYQHEILHQEWREQLNIIVMEHFSSTNPDLLASSTPINQSITYFHNAKIILNTLHYMLCNLIEWIHWNKVTCEWIEKTATIFVVVVVVIRSTCSHPGMYTKSLFY